MPRNSLFLPASVQPPVFTPTRAGVVQGERRIICSTMNPISNVFRQLFSPSALLKMTVSWQGIIPIETTYSDCYIVTRPLKRRKLQQALLMPRLPGSHRSTTVGIHFTIKQVGIPRQLVDLLVHW